MLGMGLSDGGQGHVAKVSSKFDQAVERNVLVAEREQLIVEKGLIEGSDGLFIERLGEVDSADLGTHDGCDRVNF
jgi:hypothetical protein